MHLKQIAKSVVPSYLWNKMRVFKLRHSVSSFKPYEVQHTYGGHALTVSITDPLSRGWYDSNWDRLPEIDFLSKSRLKPGAKVFDFGAHQGVVAMMLAKEVAPNGVVHALEANTHNFKTANQNKARNKISNLEFHNLAIAEKKGVLHFNEGLNGSVDNGKNEWGRVEIHCLSINDMIDQHGKPDVIFVDVEGYECKVLEAADKALSVPCDWFIEVHGKKTIESFGGTVEATIAPFKNGNYTLYMANEKNGQFVPFRDDPTVTDERFFLIALDKR